jgi:hypothetical protein
VTPAFEIKEFVVLFEVQPKAERWGEYLSKL